MSNIETARKKSGLRLEDIAIAMNCSVPTAMRLQSEPWEMKLSQFINLYKAMGTDSKAIMKKMLDDELL